LGKFILCAMLTLSLSLVSIILYNFSQAEVLLSGEGSLESGSYRVTMETTSFITPPQPPTMTPSSRTRGQSGLSPSESKSVSIDPLYSEITSELPSMDDVFDERSVNVTI